MSATCQWKCDACGKQEVRVGYGPPSGWIQVGNRGIEQWCAECARAMAKWSAVERLWRWCLCNRVVAALAIANCVLLISMALMSTLTAWQFHRHSARLYARIVELEQMQDVLHDDHRAVLPRP